MNEPIERFAYAEFPADGVAPRGVVIDFMGLNIIWMGKPDEAPRGAAFTAAGAIYVVPYLDPWNWMNSVAVEMTDRIIGLVLERAGLPPDAPVVSTGGSMGGLCALVWPRYSRRNVVAVAANCPVCDLPFHYTERPDLPRTLRAAFGAEPDFAAALAAHSPLHLAPTLPDIPHAIFHCTADQAVSKTAHSDKLVAALRALGRRVEYVEVPDRGHCDLDDDARRRYQAFAVAPLGRINNS